jgi:serine/threonine-protein kinase
MRSLICSSCGASNSEFDSQCASCGASLPDLAGPTWVDGERRQRYDPAAGEPGDDPLPGQQISHFRILERIGSGGMGAVFRALDLKLNRVVALKFLHPHRERRKHDRDRFQREAEALASLDHPNVGTIYEHNEWGDRLFIVMALYEGETLAQRIARQPGRRVPVPEAAAIATQLAMALQAIHAARLVHRDVKPENIMILKDGRVKLIDFGLARWPESSRLTGQGQVAGTLDYMAPEQIEGEDVGPEADLWALGVVLYELVAGRHPFAGKGLGKAHAILYEEPFPLREAFPEVSAALEKIVGRCLTKPAKERWGSAADILDELQISGLSDPGISSPVSPAPRPPARRFWKIAVPAAFLLLGVAIAVYFLLRPSRPVYVAVLQPEITGSLPPDDQARVKVNLRAALVRTVSLLDGLVAQDTNQVDQVQGDTLFVARHLGTDDIITSGAYCDGDNCRVTLKRLNGQTGQEVWTTSEVGLHPSKPKRFATMAADLLRNGYGKLRPRDPRLELKAGEEEYRRYLDLLQRKDDPKADPETLKELSNQLEALQQRAPDFADVYLLEARVFLRLHDLTKETVYLDQGIMVAKRFQKLAPGDPRSLTILSGLYSDAGLYREADVVLDRLAEVDLAGSLFRRGMLAELKGRSGDALKLIAKATHLHPSVNALLLLARFEYQQGFWGKARDHYKEVLRLEPKNLYGLKGLNQIELLIDPERAVKRLREATKRDRGPDSLINLGTSLLRLRHCDEAEGYLRQALGLSPDDPSAALVLADCLLLLNRPQEANKYYSQIAAITKNTTGPSDWQRLSVRAQALAHLGNTKEAESTIQIALSIAPTSQQLACEAAGVYVTLGRQALAIFHAKRAAAGGAGTYCLGFPLFDPLRQNPDFQKLLETRPPTQ